MLVFLQSLLMLREGLLEWLVRLVRGASAVAPPDQPEEDQATAEFDEERGVVFYPPVYAQRYAAVSDLLRDPRWAAQLEKVVDLGYCDLSFIKYLKEVTGVRTILGVDVETTPLARDLFHCEDYSSTREQPLKVVLFQGNAADPDYRLIGCDAVVGIELLEHMLPHDLERLVHTVFGFIKPRLVVFTTPNADFNQLFNKMLPNGMRHWDHKFEWTREQFHDWCSNIVARYPQYCVWSRGVGPGPAGTEHLGCCTQLALFVNNNYIKRADLTPDTLALITKMNPLHPPRSSHLCTDLERGDNAVASDIGFNSNIDLMSSTTLRDVSSPAGAADAAGAGGAPPSRDKPAQCDLDVERAKGYLMGCEDESGARVLRPGRETCNRVYEIEDVNCRLNCSTVRVRHFSEKSSQLMDSRPGSAERTREVIGELKHLTQMLNVSRRTCSTGAAADTPWNNICWGEDAPYWNQYYSIVKEYEYPYETKSSEQRILDLLSDEIHRAVDLEEDGELSLELGRLEIPIERLMFVVKHITTDVDQVKELLEWNGYEVIDDVVVHSRLVSNVSSDCTGRTDADWDCNEAQSTTYSEVTTLNQDNHEHGGWSEERLRRAIERKLRALRAALQDDGDAEWELAGVTGQLATLALRQAGGGGVRARRERWMQCKLYDLLALAEKAVLRRGTSSARAASAAATAATAPRLHSSTPVHECESYPDVQMSLSSICTQKSREETAHTSLEDEDRWLSGESDELPECDETVHEATPGEAAGEAEPARGGGGGGGGVRARPRAPLNRNVLLRSSVGKRGRPAARRGERARRADVLRNVGLQRPVLELTSPVHCFPGKAERRQKQHKKKQHPWCARQYTKPWASIPASPREMYAPMSGLAEQEEDSDTSASSGTTLAAAEHVGGGGYDSYAVEPTADDPSTYASADNKTYDSDYNQEYVSQCNDDSYIDDICEPSTSTGIRHNSTNVQCDMTTFTNPFFADGSPSLPDSPEIELHRSSIAATGTSVTALCTVSTEAGPTVDGAPEKLGPSLDFGGVHLHCYKDRLRSDGVVFHGHWQHHDTTGAHSTPKRRMSPPPCGAGGKRLGREPPRRRSPDVGGGKPKVDGASLSPLRGVGRLASRVSPNRNIYAKSPLSTSPRSIDRAHSKQGNAVPYSPGSPLSARREACGSSSGCRKGKCPTDSPLRTGSIVKKRKDVDKFGRNALSAINLSLSTNPSSSSGCSPCSVVTVRDRTKSLARNNNNNTSVARRDTAKLTLGRPTDAKRNVKRIKKICNRSTPNARGKENRRDASPTDTRRESGAVVDVPERCGAAARAPLADAEGAGSDATVVSSRTVVRTVLNGAESAASAYAVCGVFGGRGAAAPLGPHSLVAQTFSGYSVEYEVPVGDQYGQQCLPAAYGHGSACVDPGRQTASAEVFIPSPAADSYGACSRPEEPLVPPWLFRAFGNAEADAAGAAAAAAAVELGGGGEGAEGAGAGDGRGVHTLSSTSGDYSSSLLSTDTSFATDESLNLNGSAGVEARAEQPGSSSSDTTTSTWVRVEDELGRCTRGAAAAAAATRGSQSGAEADVSSLEADARDTRGGGATSPT